MSSSQRQDKARRAPSRALPEVVDVRRIEHEGGLVTVRAWVKTPDSSVGVSITRRPRRPNSVELLRALGAAVAAACGGLTRYQGIGLLIGYDVDRPLTPAEKAQGQRIA